MKKHITIVHEGKEGNNWYKCEYCEKDFRNEKEMTGHVVTVHEGKKPYKCEVCKKYFGRKETVERHVNEFHDGKKRSNAENR